MLKYWHKIRVRYIQRWSRYQGWLAVFQESKLIGPEWKRQAWRQSAWYEPKTGRSVEFLEQFAGKSQ